MDATVEYSELSLLDEKILEDNIYKDSQELRYICTCNINIDEGIEVEY